MYGIAQEFGSGPGGPMISGKWINRKTGSILNVRDSIITGDEMVIMTDQGQLSMEEFSKNYIQASEDIYDNNGHKIGTQKVESNEFIEEAAEPAKQNEHPAMFSEIPKNTQNSQSIQQNTKNPKNEKEKLIKAIFDKTPEPVIDITIDWTTFPANELNMLMNYFDVSKKDIAEYLSKSIDANKIIKSITELLDDRL